MTLTPVPMDTFSRIMAAMFDEKDVISVSTAFQSFFGRPENGGLTIFSPDANNVDIDIIRGNEKIAALIQRGTNSRSLGSNQKNMNAENYTSSARKYPLAEEEGDITADQVLQRVAGEGPFETKTRFERMRILGMKYNMESIRRLVRMFEVLSAQSVIEGKMDAIIGTSNTDLQYDFRRASTHTFSAAAAWDTGTPDIIADLENACDLVRADGRTEPEMCILGSGSMDAMVKDATIRALADNRRLELILVSSTNPVPEKFQRFIAGGFKARGRLITPSGYELWLFTYLDIYNDDAGTVAKYMPTDKVVVCASTARCDRYYGPPELLPTTAMKNAFYMEMFGINPDAAPMPPNMRAASNVIDSAMFYSDAYPAGDWKKVTVRTQTAPIFATTQTDAFVTIEDTLT